MKSMRTTLPRTKKTPDSKRSQRPAFPRCIRNGAFALVDLLAILTMLGILAAILLPSLFKAKIIVQTAGCVSDLHQIQAGWILYNNENNGNFPYNAIGQANMDNINWVAGFMNYNTTNPDNTNCALQVNPKHSLLAPYVRNPAVYRCPADQSMSGGLTGLPRVRSYSMSAAIGGNTNGTVTNPNQGQWLGSTSDSGTVNQTFNYTVYLRNSMMVGPLGPAALNVLVDESPDSINDGNWAFNMPANPAATYWIDKPTKLHGNAGTLSFADGHAEIHHWLAPSSIPNVTYSTQNGGSGNTVPNNPDVHWLASHTSVLYPP